MNTIETSGLRKVYRSTSRRFGKKIVALENLNLVVEKGHVFGFIGPNGAGKTTAIKILVGLISQTAGNAYVMGHPAGSVEARKNFGYLSEISYYYNFMTAEEMLDLYGRLYGMTKAERKKRIPEILEIVDLSDWQNARLGEYSKGMQQRFGIAQSLISDPPLLILDEPTSGLDPIGQKEVKDIIVRLREKGYTIFFSSHKLTEVEHICDMIGIIHKGKMLAMDTLGNMLAGAGGETLVADLEMPEDLANKISAPDINIIPEGGGIYRLSMPIQKAITELGSIQQAGAKLISMDTRKPDLEQVFVSLINKYERGEADG
ncbi:MAG: ABC transporter ATP-binding protein [Candidatus Eremiobacteraeota bacterium]|nr:ABC transporter ATP-binding protein [Candidatus Eremiobacteraeota bacterium]